MQYILAASSTSSTLTLSGSDAYGLIQDLVCLAFVVILVPVMLSGIFWIKNKSNEDNSSLISFFQIPYVTWFLIHFGISALGVIAIIVLGLDGVIGQGTVSALLGGLFGYVLGSASKNALSSPGHMRSTNGVSKAESSPSDGSDPN